jgi:tetratricopeptide (TPR) repeat protein
MQQPGSASAPPRSERDRRILLGLATRIDAADAGAHNNLGVLYFNKGMLDEAVAQFQSALEVDPRMEVARRNLEIAYFNTGYYHRLVDELTRRLAEKPDDTEARHRLARAYLHTGDPAGAVRELYRLLTDAPDDLQTLLDLGRAQKEAGRFDEALEWFRRALDLDPESAVLRFHVAELYYNRGLSEEARDELIEAVRIRPDFADAYHLLAFALGDLGDERGAAAASARAREMNPNLARAERSLSLDRYNIERFGELTVSRPERPAAIQDRYLARYNLGVAFRQKGLYAEALREFDRALTAGEDAALVREAMAEVHLYRRNGAAASALYVELLKEQGDRAKLWNELGVCRHQAGDVEKAEECYREAISRDDGYSLALNNLAVVRLHQGSPEEARRTLEAAVRVHPGLIDAHCNLGLLAMREGKYVEALRGYRAAIEHASRPAPAWTGVGMVLSEMRRYPEARNAFARAVEDAPGSAEARYNLAFVLSQIGDADAALRETRKALELDPFYSAPRFRLAIELQFEFAEVLAPPLDSGGTPDDRTVQEFRVSEDEIAALFAGLNGAAAPKPRRDPDAEAFALARDWISKGRFANALAEIRRAVVGGADAVEAALLAGEVFLGQGLAGEALERFESALTRLEGKPWSDAHTGAALGRSRSLMRLGRGAEAEEAASLPELAERDSHDALRLRGEAALLQGRADEALRLLESAAETLPRDAILLRQIGAAARADGDTARSEQALREAIETEPAYAAARIDLAELLLVMGDAEGAAEIGAGAIAMLPGYPDAVLVTALAHHRSGRSDEAIGLLVELLTADAYNFDALLRLASILVDRGRYADARQALNRVLRFDADHAVARQELERLGQEWQREPASAVQFASALRSA